MLAMNATDSHTLYSVEDVIGGAYPDTRNRQAVTTVLADLVTHLCLQRPDMALNDVRWFVADASPDQWRPYIGGRYSFATLTVCSEITYYIMSHRKLLGPRPRTQPDLRFTNDRF